jgi:creatinine amidohydrolase/Fe(II)-dependent formamide hydrolase-like protein
MLSRPLSLAVAVLIAVIPFAVFAQAPPSVFVEELTWTELRDAIRAGATTVIVPIGGTEQNGPAMVLGKHNQRVKLLSAQIASALGHTLVAPVIAYVPEGQVNPPTAHMRFPGTITIPDAAFESTLEYAARSFRQHGLLHIVLLGDHGGYQKNMVHVADKLNREWAATPARVHAVTEYYRVVDADYAAALKGKGFRDAEIGSHAGLADTSLALAVDPKLVRAERLHADKLGPEQGVRGEPGRSTAEAGQLGVELIVSHTVAAIRQAIARH